MFRHSAVFSGFSVHDLDVAHHFYGEVLGLDVTETNGLLWIHAPNGGRVVVYPKDDHQPATYTTLNIPVTDIDAAVAYLDEKGVELIRYEGYPQDGNGVMRGFGLPIGWFHDPSGNVVSVIELPEWSAG